MAEKEITTVETQETTRTFTQEEVNAIVGERIGKLRPNIPIMTKSKKRLPSTMKF